MIFFFYFYFYTLKRTSLVLNPSCLTKIIIFEQLERSVVEGPVVRQTVEQLGRSEFEGPFFRTTGTFRN